MPAVIAMAPVVGLAVGVRVLPLLGFAITLVIMLVPAALMLRWRNRRDRRLVDGLPGALDLIARALRTGQSLRHGAMLAANADPGPTSDAFRGVVHGADLGLPLRDAFLGMATSTSSHELATTSVLLAMVAEGAGGGAAAIEAGSKALRQRSELRGEVRALIAQAETSLRVVTVLPFAFVALGVISRQSGALALFVTPIGRVCLAVGLVLQAVGMLWMNVLVTRTLR